MKREVGENSAVSKESYKSKCDELMIARAEYQRLAEISFEMEETILAQEKCIRLVQECKAMQALLKAPYPSPSA